MHLWPDLGHEDLPAEAGALASVATPCSMRSGLSGLSLERAEAGQVSRGLKSQLSPPMFRALGRGLQHKASEKNPGGRWQTGPAMCAARTPRPNHLTLSPPAARAHTRLSMCATACKHEIARLRVGTPARSELDR